MGRKAARASAPAGGVIEENAALEFPAMTNREKMKNFEHFYSFVSKRNKIKVCVFCWMGSLFFLKERKKDLTNFFNFLFEFPLLFGGIGSKAKSNC